MFACGVAIWTWCVQIDRTVRLLRKSGNEVAWDKLAQRSLEPDCVDDGSSYSETSSTSWSLSTSMMWFLLCTVSQHWAILINTEQRKIWSQKWSPPMPTWGTFSIVWSCASIKHRGGSCGRLCDGIRLYRKSHYQHNGLMAELSPRTYSWQRQMSKVHSKSTDPRWFLLMACRHHFSFFHPFGQSLTNVQCTQ